MERNLQAQMEFILNQSLMNYTSKREDSVNFESNKAKGNVAPIRGGSSFWPSRQPPPPDPHGQFATAMTHLSTIVQNSGVNRSDFAKLVKLRKLEEHVEIEVLSIYDVAVAKGQG
jgi:hypothetical protein